MAMFTKQFGHNSPKLAILLACNPPSHEMLQYDLASFDCPDVQQWVCTTGTGWVLAAAITRVIAKT